MEIWCSTEIKKSLFSTVVKKMLCVVRTSRHAPPKINSWIFAQISIRALLKLNKINFKHLNIQCLKFRIFGNFEA